MLSAPMQTQSHHGGWITGPCHLLLRSLSDGTQQRLHGVVGKRQGRHVATLLLKGRHIHLDHHGRHHRTTQMEDGDGRLLQHCWMLGTLGQDKTG